MMHIRTPGVAISASTTTASAQLLPDGNAGKFIRVVNGSATAVAYVTAGGSGVTATNANIALAPFETAIFERDPTTDTYVAALLSAGTGIVSASIVGAD